MGTAIVITSGKGGTGKTTSAGAISSCLAYLGHRTIAIDLDVGLRNLDLVLGLTDVSTTDFTDVLDGGLSLEEAAVKHPDIENLWFLSAPSTVSAEDIDKEKMAVLIAAAKREYEYVILDCPAGLGAGFRLAAEGADMAIIAATGDAASLRDGQRTAAELYDMGFENVRLLINRARPKVLKRTRTTVDDLINAVGARLIGIVSEDERVIMAANLERPLIKYDIQGASEQYYRIARRILGDEVPLGKI